MRNGVLVAAAVLLLAACGTTVPLAQRGGTQGAGLGSGATSPNVLPSGGPAATSDLKVVGGDPATVTTVGPPTPDTAAWSGPGGNSHPGGTTVGTSVPVKVGIPYAKNSGAALSALGGSSSNASDQSTMFKAVIADANRHGGIDGHPIVPVFFGIDVTGDQATQFQAACADFTQDNKVFAAVGTGSTSYYTCLQKAGVLVLTSPDGDHAEQAQWPLQLSPNDMTLDRAARTYVAALRDSYLVGKPRIGLLTYSDPTYQRVMNRFVLPALREVDPATQVVSVTRAQNATDVASMSSAVSNAVLRFKSTGVDHVVFFVDGGLPESFFANDAQSQGFHPTYAFNTLDQLEATIESGLFGSASQQLPHAVGVGWQPILDTAYPSPFMSTAAARRCVAVGKAGGVQPSSSVSAAQLATACDDIWFLQTAAARARAVAPGEVVSAALTMGSSFVSSVTFRTFFHGNHDGASAYQLLAFHTDCTCIRASGPVRKAST